jgi:hypothetical protein
VRVRSNSRRGQIPNRDRNNDHFKPQNITTALTAATATGLTTSSPALAEIAGISRLAGGGAINIFDYFVSRKNARRDKLRTNAYSYLYLAEKQLPATS